MVHLHVALLEKLFTKRLLVKANGNGEDKQQNLTRHVLATSVWPCFANTHQAKEVQIVNLSSRFRNKSYDLSGKRYNPSSELEKSRLF